MANNSLIDTCPYCGHQRPFGAWAAAHLTETLTTQCESSSCQKLYLVVRGVGVNSNKKRKATKQEVQP